jgi:hypothetical protein
MIIHKLSLEDKSVVEGFCKECEALGWVNNSSLKAMKFERTINEGGGFFGITVNDKLVSVAGYQYLPQISENAWRIFFRSATLPKSGTNKGLHRGTGARGKLYINSFITELPTKDLYVTTNVENPVYGEITRYDRSLKIESKINDSYIEYIKEVILYDTPQTLWKLNVEKFLESTKNDN